MSLSSAYLIAAAVYHGINHVLGLNYGIRYRNGDELGSEMERLPESLMRSFLKAGAAETGRQLVTTAFKFHEEYHPIN